MVLCEILFNHTEIEKINTQKVKTVVVHFYVALMRNEIKSLSIHALIIRERLHNFSKRNLPEKENQSMKKAIQLVIAL